VGEVVPGVQPTVQLKRGEAARIMTGAPLPQGADAVQKVEVCKEVGDRVEISKPVVPGQNVAPKGEDAAAGDVVLGPGAVIGPGAVALLASVGASTISVRRRPRVALAVTGGEIVPPDGTPSPYQIRNANGPALAARLRAAGVDVVELGIIGDGEEELGRLFADIERFDALIVTGGVSKGRYDFVKKVLKDRGAEFLFSGVKIKPGKPATAAVISDRLVFALPGNPVSSLVTTELFVVPALRSMVGLPSPLPVVMRAELRGKVNADNVRTVFYPAELGWNEGVPAAMPLPYHGSGDFTDAPPR